MFVCGNLFACALQTQPTQRGFSPKNLATSTPTSACKRPNTPIYSGGGLGRRNNCYDKVLPAAYAFGSGFKYTNMHMLYLNCPISNSFVVCFKPIILAMVNDFGFFYCLCTILHLKKNFITKKKILCRAAFPSDTIFAATQPARHTCIYFHVGFGLSTIFHQQLSTSYYH